jgi:hypothetical protein
MNEINEWVTAHVTDLFGGPATVVADREEITVVGPLPATEATAGSPAEVAQQIADYRERTRADRMSVAREAEELFRRKVSWGVTVGEETTMFTHLAVPVMTRLRQNDRRVLDTLVAGGVARSRADALAWCVRLVGQHEDDWIQRLREALRGVEEARAGGPTAG